MPPRWAQRPLPKESNNQACIHDAYEFHVLVLGKGVYVCCGLWVMASQLEHVFRQALRVCRCVRGSSQTRRLEGRRGQSDQAMLRHSGWSCCCSNSSSIHRFVTRPRLVALLAVSAGLTRLLLLILDTLHRSVLQCSLLHALLITRPSDLK